MFVRIAFALPFGTAVTAGLLFMMHLLIATGRGEIDEPAARRVVDFVRVERSEVVETKRERPERPQAPERAPDLPRPDLAQDFQTTIGLEIREPEVELGTGISNFGLDDRDGEYLPIVKVSPVYPLRALQRRLEGYVIVQFVVTTSGAVRDVVVVESSSDIFEKPAIEAARKFKYKPRIVDGQPIEVSGVQNRITFKLDA